METPWYYAAGKEKVGPFSFGQLQELVLAGTLQPASMVWQEGTQKWVTASAVAGLFPVGSPRPFRAADVVRPTTYRRGGRDVFLDACRRVLVPATPEEEVRQQVVTYLQLELGVPLDCIATEDHLAHYKSRAAGRADVVVSSLDGVPLFEVECKAPAVPLGDDALDQVLGYHSVIKGRAQVVVTTNGWDTRWYKVLPNGKAEQLVAAPFFLDVLRGTLPPPKPPKQLPPRPNVNPTTKERDGLVAADLLGQGSPASNHTYLANLIGLLCFDLSEPEYSGRRDAFTVKKTGCRETTFGNAAGGDWPGVYRYFLIHDGAGEAQVISFTIAAKFFQENHPRFGHGNGHTIFIVAVDDGEHSHNSLQLDLDRFVECTSDTMRIWHDGTLTRGNRGAASRADVLVFVSEKAPHLVSNGRIELGVLPHGRWVTWQDAEPFICNCIEYALVRDCFRRQAGSREVIDQTLR